MAEQSSTIEQYNDGWKHVAGQNGQGELLQEPPARQYYAGEVTPMDVAGLLPLPVPIDRIQPNPYQPRSEDDPAAVAEIAVSIYRNGLMQVPTARQVDGHYELAFGHTRLAAFALLAATGIPDAGIAPDQRFAEMPLHIRELTNRQMFEMASAENIKRRQLNPIEQATAMRTYRDEFGASSKEIGELFGLADATVRGTMRLLNLPEPVQQKIVAGEITQGAARKLLTVAKILNADHVTAIASSIAGGSDTESTLHYHLRQVDHIVTMRENWQTEKPIRAGSGLWPLDEKIEPASLPQLEPKNIDAGELPRTRVKYYLQTLQDDAAALPRLIDENETEAEVIERIAHLLRPPTCENCPFHTIANSAHYCGFKPCHKRKSQAWVDGEMPVISKKLGIPAYDPETDGKAFVPVLENGWGDEYNKHKKLVEAKCPDLRLQANKSSHYNHSYTGSSIIRLIFVGKTAEKLKSAKESETAAAKAANEKRQQEWDQRNQCSAASEKFLKAYDIVPLFAVAFKKLDNLAVLASMTRMAISKDEADGNRAELLDKLRRRLADHTLEYSVISYELKGKGPVALVKHLQGVATSWGIKLPDDILEVAKTFDPTVSVETPKRKGKKNGNAQ